MSNFRNHVSRETSKGGISAKPLKTVLSFLKTPGRQEIPCVFLYVPCAVLTLK